MVLEGERGLLGGCWTPEAPKNAWIGMENADLDVKGMSRAELMMHFTTWDPAGRKKVPLSLCSVPLDKSFADSTGNSARGSYAMLHLLGQILSKDSGCVIGVCFDAHGSHQWIRKILHGQHEAQNGVDPAVVASIPFFCDLTFTDLPQTLAVNGDNFCFFLHIFDYI